MPGHDIITVGASAGGVEALIELVAGLPADLAAAVCVVLHFPSDGTSVLPKILRRSGPLPAHHAQDGEIPVPGHIYVAPPDRHLLFDAGVIRTTTGPRENGHRPAIDPMFRSAARTYGPRAVGVVLSGSGDDGTAGLLLVKRYGGVTVVQDPKDAIVTGMPQSAMEVVGAEHVLPVGQMGALLARLALEPVTVAGATERGGTMSEQIQAAEDIYRVEHGADPTALSGFSCPDCGGRLWEVRDREMFRFRCRVGHAYSPDSLLQTKNQALEGALWAALNALEESAALARRLASDARSRRHDLTASRFQAKAEDTDSQVALLRELLLAEDGVHTGGLHAANADENETAGAMRGAE